MFWNFFYDRDIKEFLDSFNNEIFSKFAKDLFEKIIKRCGKLDGNDITDALIISGLNSKDYKLLTIDYKIQKFLKEEGLYSEELYKKIEQ